MRTLPPYKPYTNMCETCHRNIPGYFRVTNFECNYCRRGYSFEFHNISEQMRKSGKCFICGDKTKLHVHHKDKNKKNNSPDNLMILCVQCHGSIHKHGLKMPIAVKRGSFGKRLIYKNNPGVAVKIDKRDHRYGKVFTKKIKNEHVYLLV